MGGLLTSILRLKQYNSPEQFPLAQIANIKKMYKL